MPTFLKTCKLGGAAFLFAFAASPAAPSDRVKSDRVKTVQFPAGATSTTLRGTIKGHNGVDYVFEARAGQTLQMLFEPSNRSCYFNLWEPGAAEASHIGSTSGNEFGKTLALDGTYKAQVYLMRSAARRGQTCRYGLSIEITGTTGGVSAGVSDLAMQDRCKGEAASMYGVEPRQIAAGAVKPDGSGFLIDATADKQAEGAKSLRCIFRSDRSYDHIVATTPDGK
jgi:hypothetical protein